MAGSLTVVGLGPAGIEQVTVGVLRRLGLGGRLFVRTRRHPAVADLEAMGFRFSSMDDLYESAADYDQLYEDIARRLVAAAQGLPADAGDGPAGQNAGSVGEQPSAAECEVVYAVPGHPTVAERSVRRAVELAREAGLPVEVVAGLSWLDAAWAELLLDPTGLRNLVVADAKDDQVTFAPHCNYLISHLHHPLVAAELKIRLMEAFPDEHRVVVFQAGGLAEGHRVEIPLYELDRLPWLDPLTSLWVPALAGARTYPLDKLVSVMARLRGEDGCPWDREQTHASLKPYLIEEAYEVWDAIDEEDPAKLCEELGDLLLQVVFHAQLASEAGAFDVNDVVRGIVDKLIRRHPHVFGEVDVSGAGEVVVNWEKIKRGERGYEERRSALDGIPRHLPALLTAQKVQGKAARTGFEWPSFSAAVAKALEEAREVRRAYGAGQDGEGGRDQDKLEEEIGDLLFAVVNVARFLEVDAEAALRRAVAKFARRFRRMEERVREDGAQLAQLSLDQLLGLWEEAKRREKPSPSSGEGES